ncbi:hypothetical protein V3N99_11630 [Dermatophilaceae bacterium Soc4.6]
MPHLAAAGHAVTVVSRGRRSPCPLLGLTEAVARWWGHEAQVELQPLPVCSASIAPEHVFTTVDLLGFRPAWTGLETVKDAVGWLTDDGQLPPLVA